jgi:hypothetical protein
MLIIPRFLIIYNLNIYRTLYFITESVRSVTTNNIFNTLRDRLIVAPNKC